MLKITNPSTGETIATLRTDDQTSIDEKFAQLAMQSSCATLSERKQGLYNFAQNLLKHSNQLATTLSQEMGKPIKQALGEVKDTAKRVTFFLENIDALAQPCVINSSEEIRFEPLGMVLCISAWNYPYFVSTNVVLPALLAGCSVMFKPSEFATLSGQKMCELLWQEQPFKNCLSLVVGGKDVGAQLVQKNFDGVFFTGSERAGQEIKQALGSRMIKNQFELGGKDAAFIANDCALDFSVASTLDGAFYNCGQSCCSIERIYVHADIASVFIAKFIEAAKSMVVGNPMLETTYLGPLTRREHIDFLLHQVQDAKSKGATIALGGKTLPGPGNFFEPTVVINANSTMSVMVEESFGPIVAIEVVNSDEEAIEKINSSRFGLTAACYCEDLRRAEGILSKLDVGSVYWNCCDKVSSALPWSGRKNSGLGSTLSTIGMATFFKPKAWYKAGKKS